MNRQERRAAAHKDRKLARKPASPLPARCHPAGRHPENGFEAQKRKSEELRIKNQRHEMKKEHHEWGIRLKDAAFCHRVGPNVSHTNQAIRENPSFKAQYMAEIEAKLNRDREGAHRSEVAESAAA